MFSSKCLIEIIESGHRAGRPIADHHNTATVAAVFAVRVTAVLAVELASGCPVLAPIFRLLVARFVRSAAQMRRKTEAQKELAESRAHTHTSISIVSEELKRGENSLGLSTMTE